MYWLVHLVPYLGLWQQVMVHYVKENKAALSTFLEILSPFRIVCRKMPHVSLTQWTLSKSESAVRRPFRKWPSCSSAASLWKVDNVKKSISLLMYIEISLLKTLKGLTREVQYKQLLSKAFLEATRSNNGSRLSINQETRWSLFVLFAKCRGSCISNQKFITSSCIWFMNKNVGCWLGIVLQRYVFVFYEKLWNNLKGFYLFQCERM